jgi:hypothetical protein
MADVFISYATDDREWAARLARALESFGWSVWWDRKLFVGQSFDETIELELGRAKVVIVLWSRESINRRWVRNEARLAAERDALVPARIDDVKLPLEFSDKQAANLIGWKGEFNHDGFDQLRRSLELGVAPVQRPMSSDSAKQLSPATWAGERLWLASAVILSAIALSSYMAVSRRSAPADETYAELAGAQKRAAVLGDVAEVGRNIQSIEKAAGNSPDDTRFRSLLSDARQVARSLKIRDETSGELAAAQKEHAGCSKQVTFIGVPPLGQLSDSTGNINGKICGVPEIGNLKIVIYARADVWYVQPLIDLPFTDVDGSGNWGNWTHRGDRYAVLVVRPSFNPSPMLNALPSIGGDVVAKGEISAPQ